jgi:hypothetical protein
VSNAGDINGDGITDLLVGAEGASQAYVIFGGPPACPSPSPSPTPSASISPSPSPSDSLSPSVSLSNSPSISPSLSLSPSVSLSPSASVSPSPSPSALASPSVSVSASPSASPSASSSILPKTSSPLRVSVSPAASSSPSLSANPNLTTSATPSVVPNTSLLETRTISTATKTKQTKTAKTVQTPTAGTQTELASRSVAKTDTPRVPVASAERNFLVQGGHQHRIGNLKGDIINLKVRDLDTATENRALQARGAPDGSSSLRTEPLWVGLPMLSAAQLPLAQTSMHLMQQGYNRIMNWFQGTSSDEGIQIQELLSTGQVAGFLQDYNKISQELESILQQLELDNTVSSSMLSWLKESIVEHRAQGQRLVQQSIITQENIQTYLENIQIVTKDVNEMVEDLAADRNSNHTVSYTKARLNDVNQLLSMLSENPVIVAKDQGTLRANVRAQIQANTLQQQQQAMNLVPQPPAANLNTQLTADVMGLLV